MSLLLLKPSSNHLDPMFTQHFFKQLYHFMIFYCFDWHYLEDDYLILIKGVIHHFSEPNLWRDHIFLLVLFFACFSIFEQVRLIVVLQIIDITQHHLQDYHQSINYIAINQLLSEYFHVPHFSCLNYCLLFSTLIYILHFVVLMHMQSLFYSFAPSHFIVVDFI